MNTASLPQPRMNSRMSTSWFRLVFLATAFFIAAAPAARAQTISLIGIDDPGYAWSRTWIDVNGDGRDDYCVVAGRDGERLECYLSTGTAFDAVKKVYSIPSGKGPYSVRWPDLNGDGIPDICRSFEPSSGYRPASALPNEGGLRCQLGPTFTTSVTVLIPRQGWGGDNNGLSDWANVYAVDVNGDGRSDICYIYSARGTNTLRCLLSNGAGANPQSAAWISMPLEMGSFDWPRNFYDFNGDGSPDFCRVASVNNQTVLKCLLGSPTGFTTTDVTSGPLIPSYKEGAAFVDINGDGKTDFCRITGSSAALALSCMMSNGLSWETVERTSPTIPDAEIGDAQARWWVDINGDGLPDFCRAVPTQRLACRLSRGDGDGSSPYAFGFSDVSIGNVDFGVAQGGRGFCDATGNGLQTFCRQSNVQISVEPVCEFLETEVCSLPTANAMNLVAGLLPQTSITSPDFQARQPVLTAFSDGVGAETRISYLPLTSPDIYTRSGVGTYPRALIAQPRSLAVYETRSFLTGTSTPLTGIARYSYKDLRNDTWLGSRGFRERWIFTESSNSLEHVVFYQGLGPTIDTDSLLDDRREIGMTKVQERFAVANGYLPVPATNGPLMSPRTLALRNIMNRAKQSVSIQPVPNVQSPFILLQRTSNTLADATPDPARLSPVPAASRPRFIGTSNVQSWDWNNDTGIAVAMPTVLSSTEMTDLGNIIRLVQTTTEPNSLVWSKTTTNQYDPGQQNIGSWMLGRLTKTTVVSTAPTAAQQLAAYPRSAGNSPLATSMASSTPASAQPVHPAVLSTILQLLLGD